jgi:hypothetical protein
MMIVIGVILALLGIKQLMPMMVDARLATHWLGHPDFDFSHAAWVCFTKALMYCNHYGTDGLIKLKQLSNFHEDYEDAVDELVDAGIFEVSDDGTNLQFIGWSDLTKLNQSTKAEIDAKRKANASRQAKYRSAK